MYSLHHIITMVILFMKKKVKIFACIFPFKTIKFYTCLSTLHNSSSWVHISLNAFPAKWSKMWEFHITSSEKYISISRKVFQINNKSITYSRLNLRESKDISHKKSAYSREKQYPINVIYNISLSPVHH